MTARLRLGEVTAVGTSTADVNLDGVDVTVFRVGTPTVGHIGVCVQDGRRIVLIAAVKEYTGGGD